MMIKNSLSQELKLKQNQKKQLNQLKNRYIVAIFEGIKKGESVKEIHKRLFDETINAKKLGYATSKNALKVAGILARKLSEKANAVPTQALKKKYGTDVSVETSVGMLAFELINKYKVERNISTIINDDIKRVDGKRKEKIIGDAIKDNRERSRVFYLASTHKDSAEDHEDYQGRIYIDEKWRSVWRNDKNVIYEIEAYIRKHDTKTIQWVTGKPVWFITRPNCRHYFVELSVEEVLKKTLKELIAEHKVESAIGDREYLQTPKHPTNKEWYDDVRNAELLLEKYKERLALHKQLLAKDKNNILIDRAIEKDKFLIEKWEKYIEERKRKS